jgi:hypothetical protein
MEFVLLATVAVTAITVLMYQAIQVFRADAARHHPCNSFTVRRTVSYAPYGGRSSHGYPTRDQGVW